MINPSLRILTGTVGSLGTTSEIVLEIDKELRPVHIKQIMLQRNSGTGANYTPRLGNVTAFTTGTIDEKYLGSATAVAVLTDDAEINSFCNTDATGKLYLIPGPDAGADTSFTYSVAIFVY